MNKLVLTIITLFSLISCKPSREDTCKCFKQSANEYMLKGVRPTLEDLAISCNVDKGDYNIKEKAALADCAQEVMEAVNIKKLIPIEGEELPEFPTYNFKSTQDFLAALANNSGSEYKYLKTRITIQNAYSKSKPTPIEGGEVSLFASDINDENSIFLFGKSDDFDTSKFAMSTGISDYDDDIIWDTQNNRSVSTGFHEGQLIKWLIEYTNGVTSNSLLTRTISENQNDNVEKYLQQETAKLMTMEGFKTLPKDLADGRYKLVPRTELGSNSGEEKTQFSLSGTYLGTKTIQAYGSEVTTSNIGDGNIFAIKAMNLPAALQGKGKSIDISSLVKDQNIQPVSKSTSPTNDDIHEVIVDKAYFYQEPDRTKKRKGYLLKGQVVSVSKRQGDFAYCKYSGGKGITEGWMLWGEMN